MAEFRARLRPKPGSIMADGSITLAPGQHTFPGAPVWIERRRLAAAERFGWRPSHYLPTPQALAMDLVSVLPPERLREAGAHPPGHVLADGSVVDYQGHARTFAAFVPLNLTPLQLHYLGLAGWRKTASCDWPSMLPTSSVTHISRPCR